MACKDCPPNEPPKHAVRWRAWYVGGAVYDSEATAWVALPPVGVLGVKVWFADGGARLCSGDTWYWLLVTPEGWTIAHSSEPIEELRAVYGDQPFKRGQWTLEEEMHRVNAEMDAA
jgi:hypothetical protein